MVNRGPSTACLTCKRRRISCDQAKPTCVRCRRASISCEGYQTKTKQVRFKDETSAIVERYKQEATQTVVVFGSPLAHNFPVNKQNAAVQFFLCNFAIYGRDPGSSRGFFENIVPTLTGSTSDSSAVLAVSALSLEMYSRWRRATKEDGQKMEVLGKALRKLRSDLQRPETARSDSTLLAILVLQFLEGLSALFSLQSANHVHHDGALAFVPRTGLIGFQSDTAKKFMLYTRNVDISAALCEKRLVHPELCGWHDADAIMLKTPNFTLDSIGIAVAQIQHEFVSLAAPWPDSSSYTILTDLYLRARVIEDQLVAWRKTTPRRWGPCRWRNSGQDKRQIDMYLDTCDVYLSIQTGSILNTWRTYRLIVSQVMVQVVCKLQLEPRAHTVPVSTYSDLASDDAVLKDRMQNIVDEICFSVAFHLGNRTDPSSVRDMGDKQLMFPSYFNMLPQDPESGFLLELTKTMSEKDHTSHVIAQGVWCIMIPLGHLVSLCSSQKVVLSALRGGQQDWICRSFLRCLFLLGIDGVQIPSEENQQERDLSKSMLLVEAERCATMVRDSLRLTSGS